MKYRLITSTLFVLFSAFSLSVFAGEKKYALIWGNSEYYGQWQNLPAVKNDVDTIAKIFKSLDFKTTVLLDGNLDQMKKSLRDFSRVAKNADTIVFYYSGHAQRLDDSYYLIPAKTKIDTLLLSSDLFPAEDILAITNNIRLRLLFFDSCREKSSIPGVSKSGNPNVRQSKHIGPNSNNNEEKRLLPSGTMVCYACELGKAVYSNETLSPFTKYLAAHLLDNDEFRTVFANIIEEMRSKKYQIPVNDGFYKHDFYLNPSASRNSGNKNIPTTIPTKKIITINTNVSNATLEFGGKKFNAGKPLSFEIGKTYSYTISAPGYKTLTETLVVSEETPQNYNFILKKIKEDDVANLEVTSNVKADVSFDGEFIGQTPLVIAALYGLHTLSLYADDYKDYKSKININTDNDKKNITLKRKYPWFWRWVDYENATHYISYFFSPNYQIGVDYLYRINETKFLIGSNLAFSLGFFQGNLKYQPNIEQNSQSTYTYPNSITDETGNTINYASIVTIQDPPIDEYSKEFDPYNEAKIYDSNARFLITGGYSLCNGIILETGLGFASHRDYIYMPNYYGIIKSVVVNTDTGEILADNSPNYQKVEKSRWYKGEIKWSPALRLGTKTNIPIFKDYDLYLTLGGGYTFLFNNSKFSSWDLSIGFAFTLY